MLEINKSRLESGLLEANQIQPSNHFARERTGYDRTERPGAAPQWKAVHDFGKHCKPRFSILVLWGVN
jgi:hypothetical protein